YWRTFGGANFGGLGGPVNWLHPGEPGPHAGRGPRSYKRPDDRILEDVVEQLTRDGMIDATNIDIAVQDGEVTLTGMVEDRETKRRAEEDVDCVWGVRDIHNYIRINLFSQAA